MARNPKYPSHATPHFWREMQLKTLQARQVDLSRLRRSRSAASRRIGRFAAKKGSLRSPRGRLVASLLLTLTYTFLFLVGITTLHCRYICSLVT